MRFKMGGMRRVPQRMERDIYMLSNGESLPLASAVFVSPSHARDGQNDLFRIQNSRYRRSSDAQRPGYTILPVHLPVAPRAQFVPAIAKLLPPSRSLYKDA